MRKLEQAFRTLVAGFIIASYLTFAFVGRLFLPDKKLRRSFFLHHVNAYAKVLLRVIGVEVQVDHPERIREHQNYLILANHMSYLDAIVMAALRPMCFVTSEEVRATPLLGQITELGGCLFVERRSRDNLHREIGAIAGALSQGFHVVIFPEATSTDGNRILPFKRSLLKASVETGTPVLPLVIQYDAIGEDKVSTRNRDLLCWYGDMLFGPHFFALMGLRSIKIRVKVLPEIPVTGESTRDTLVEQAYQAISSNFEPIV